MGKPPKQSPSRKRRTKRRKGNSKGATAMRKGDHQGLVTPLSALENAPVVQLDNGDMLIPKDTLRRVRNERLRRVAISGVPGTPRHLTRDGGGVGVAKGGSRVYQITMEALRSIRERAPILQVIHRARAVQIGRMSEPWSGRRGDVGYRVVHKDNHHRDALPPDGFDRWIKRFEGLLERPAPMYGCTTMSDLMVPLEEDYLTLNRPCVEVLHSALDRERMVGFKPVDAAIVWPTLVWLEKWKRENPKWHLPYDRNALTTTQELDIASAAIGADLFLSKFAIVRDGILEAVAAPHKIIVAPQVNRTDINVAGYPPSVVEQAIELAVAFINGFDYNHNFFTRGMMAEFILGVSGDLHDDDVDAFVDMFRESTQGVSRAWQVPVMPLPGDGDIKKIDLKAANKDMMYEVWTSLLVALCAAAYRMDPTTINAKPWDGGQGGTLGAPNRGQEIALAKEEGLQADLKHLASHILNPLARRVHPDLRVIYEYGDFDPEKEAKIYEIRSKVDMTRNDVRIVNGDKPNGFWLTRKKYDELTEELVDLALKGDLEEDEEEPEVGPDGVPTAPKPKKKDRTDLIQSVLDRYEANLWNQPADQGFSSAYLQAKQAEQFADQEEPPPDDGFGAPPGGFPGAPGQLPPQDGGGAPMPPGGSPPGGKFPFGQTPVSMQKADTRGVTVYVHPLD